jgi:hypothetical protein
MTIAKGSFNIQGILISIALVSLFFGVIAGVISSVSDGYDISEYNGTIINNYNNLQNLSEDLNRAGDQIEDVTIDRGLYDFFSDIYNKIISPFKFIYRSYQTMDRLGSLAVDQFELLPVFKQWLSAVILIVVLVGIVMIKFYMGRNK